MLQHAASSNDEVCGFLAGHVEFTAERIYPVSNIAEKPHTSFLMEPHEQYEAMVSIEEQGMQVSAIYHSHPDGAQTGFSTSDLAGAWGYPHVAHIVISHSSTGYVLRAFLLRDRKPEELDIMVRWTQ